MLLKLERGFDKFADIIGYFTAFIMVLMILNVTYDVIMRYFFHTGSIAMQEMEWHLFSVIILLGISYTLKEDGHVRVDVIYDNLSIKKKSIINIFGVIFFLFPIAALVAFGSIDFAKEAYEFNEVSGDPGGLTHRWLIKSLIPISFFILIFTGIGYIIKNINLYRGSHNSHVHSFENIEQEAK